MSDEEPLKSAKRIVEAAGYVVIKRKSYDAYQLAKRIAENRAEYEKRDRMSADKHTEQLQKEVRRLMDRITFLYGEARAHGASVGELAGDLIEPGEKTCDAAERTVERRNGVTFDMEAGTAWVCNRRRGHTGPHRVYDREKQDVIHHQW